MTHEHEATIGKTSKGKRVKIQERNQLIFIWKNLTSKFLFRKHLMGLGKRLLRHPGYFIIFFMAFSKIRAIKRARNKELKESKISE